MTETPRDGMNIFRVEGAIEAGQVFVVRYPFLRTTREVEFGVTEPTWQPGTEYRVTDHVTDHYVGDVVASADGVGSMTLTVVSVHKPGRFPTRVFFTRQFTTPDGKTFGKSKCHIATIDKFRRLACCFQIEFEVGQSAEQKAEAIR